MVNAIELQCIDNLGNVSKDIFHQIGELTLFGRQVMSASIFQFINIAPKQTKLNFLLPHEILSNDVKITNIKICIYGRTDNGHTFEKSLCTPMQLYSETEVRFPLKGKWHIINGPGLYGIHREAFSCMEGRISSPQRFALDIVKVDDSLKNFTHSGNKNDDYYSFGELIYAPLSGRIADVIYDISDNLPGDRNWIHIKGNYVILETRSDRTVLLAHMKKDSISVKQGDIVREGELIGSVGNSGNSSQPHLHLHLSEGSDSDFSNGLPMIFKKKGFLLSGDIVHN